MRARFGEGPAIGKVCPFIRSHPDLLTNGLNIFRYHQPAHAGAPILCDFGVEVTRTFETVGEVSATETPGDEPAVAVHERPLQSHERGARRDQKMDGGESEGIRWALLGDIRRSDAVSGRH